MLLIILIIYLIGFIASYLLNRYYFRRDCKHGEEYTKIDRLFILLLSTPSWFSVILSITEDYFTHHGEEKAKW